MSVSRLLTLSLALSWACSWRYDTEDLRAEDPGDVVDDGDNGGRSDGGNAEGIDAAPSIDAAPPVDAAQNPGDCGDLGEACCTTDPICGFGDEFIECDEAQGVCEECGRTGLPCCKTGPECEGGLGCVALIGLVETCVTLSGTQSDTSTNPQH